MGNILFPDPLAIKSMDDIEPGKSVAVVLGMLPVLICLLNWLGGIFFGSDFISNANRFNRWELLFVVGGFTIDDYCTAIGMQAEEVPRSTMEGNPWVAGVMQFWINQGLAKTETAAHRLTYIVVMCILLLFQYNGWYSATRV